MTSFIELVLEKYSFFLFPGRRWGKTPPLDGGHSGFVCFVLFNLYPFPLETISDSCDVFIIFPRYTWKSIIYCKCIFFSMRFCHYIFIDACFLSLHFYLCLLFVITFLFMPTFCQYIFIDACFFSLHWNHWNSDPLNFLRYHLQKTNT